MKKRILFVEQNQDGTIGGSHYCLLYLVQLLDRDRFDPVVMFYEENELLNNFRKVRSKVIVFKKPRGKRFIRQHVLTKILSPILIIAQKSFNFVRGTLLPVLKFARFIKRERIDLVHLNNAVTAGKEWILASKVTGTPCLTFQRGYHTSLSSIQKFIGNSFDGIYCVSDVIRKNLMENGINSKICFTLYDGIDPQRLKREIRRAPSEVRREFDVSKSNGYLIGMVGNFMTWKGQDILVEAMALLTKKYPDIRCLCIGAVGTDVRNIRYYENIKKTIEKYGLGKNVIITGYRKDVADLLNALDVQVHPPTLPDPFPHVILEGMSLGKAIVAANHGGAIESLEDGVSGLLFEAGNPVELYEKVSLLLSDTRLRKTMGEMARERVAEKFHIRLNVRNVEEVYMNLLYNDPRK